MKKIPRLMILLIIIGFGACQKYKDKQSVADPRLTNHYCNDPDAVNYNWGFPGIADNTVCFYPNDLFVGKYVYYDSVLQSDFSHTYSRIDTLYITSGSHTAISVTGFCAPGGTLHLTASKTYIATLDTSVGTGQLLCRVQDTVSGTISKNLSDTLPLIHVYFTVVADTGTTYHIGYGRKI